MADYEGNGLAAFNDSRPRGWSGSVTLADLEKLSAGNPIMQGIAAVWPDAPQSKPQSSVDWLRQYLPSSMGDWLARSEAEGLQWGKDMSNPRNAAGEVISTAMNLVPMGRLAVPRPGIRAYHGSPYDFDRFDMSRIGTGEGAQAYGHGLYFAENPKTATAYRDNLADRVMNSTAGPMRYGDIYTTLEGVAQKQGLHPDQAYQLTRQVMDKIERGAPLDDIEYPVKQFNDAYYAIADHAQKFGFTPNKGKMYEVNINAKPEQFLDWDRPLNQQSPELQGRLGEAIGKPSLARYSDLSARLDEIASRPAAAHKANPQWVHEWDKLNAERNSLGIDPGLIKQQGANIYESNKLVPGEYRDPVAASQTLQNAGIPGIRYLDRGSRSEGAGTSNYVLFNDKIVDIMKKWSLAGAIPFAAASDYDGRF